MARHLAPFPWRQMIAESVRRRSWGGVLPLGRQVSISGSSRAHCASVSMAPPRSGKAKRLRPQPVQDRTDRRTLDRLEVPNGSVDLTNRGESHGVNQPVIEKPASG